MAENKLYVVATPIGNLADITQRAVEILNSVDCIAAEDTRHTKRLLNHLTIEKPLLAAHDHNEDQVAKRIIDKLSAGESMALVSDAGTPLIADPGYHVTQAVVEAGFDVVPIPGSCAIIAALSAAALPTDRFLFDGFLPAKSHGRQAYFQSILEQERTVVVYDSPHRITASLSDLIEVMGDDKQLVVAREITKTFETFLRGSASDILKTMQDDANQQKGEFVIMIRGAQAKKHQEVSQEAIDLTLLLSTELPMKKAAALAATHTGYKKNQLYQLALEAK
ncbi:16S rRNA (cytidine(1402)-2'-O)-methyltransferase [Bermanella marisrubri]|uniref:Ribosomal RNA small subunit methyltransferase I n=1 Tax=Bermanella marisrubri TaxID=207949 RepID=Q1MYA9_9GAMM|nr:16S rRNA (cytidine(1402)-2'-O)-methyltransferase [Bermanella marisrubri]EAT10958.1 predicted methyltransferase [Oceanobacter sp. RED65] [Bermanella marisrubri]QIZ85105.1 16S rRNA (cytidine(1402)-2'-O)-methyltransferase [Bermanella marisrubri]